MIFSLLFQAWCVYAKKWLISWMPCTKAWHIHLYLVQTFVRPLVVFFMRCLRNVNLLQENQRLIMLSRYPQAGKCKTRLIPSVGAIAASQIQSIMTEKMVSTLEGPWDFEVNNFFFVDCLDGNNVGTFFLFSDRNMFFLHMHLFFHTFLLSVFELFSLRFYL
jgi:hypothetical protein